MKIEITLKCKMDGNHQIDFQYDKPSDLVTIATYQGVQSHVTQITLKDLRRIIDIFYNS
jgi:hypothetical protein